MYTAAGETPSSAQMVLSGLNNLFSPVEHATLQLYKFVDKMTVSEHWDCVDIVDQSAKLKVSILTRGSSVAICMYTGAGSGQLILQRTVLHQKGFSSVGFLSRVNSTAACYES